MNEFEQSILKGIHEVELKLTGEISELKGAISGLRETVETNIGIDTTRLNKHAEELDTLRQKQAKLEEWKSQFEKQVSHRIAISQSITTIAAVLIAFLLNRFL